MADSTTPPPPQPASSGAGATPKPPVQNPALRMLGLPNLPRKLPSRNWMIFWAVTGAITVAISYDRREKRRATAKWRRAVAPLAEERLASPSQLPRKLTVYLEAPPGDSLRAAQDHFIEYAKPVLASSGLDWEFVQGRQQGDVRAVVAENIRRRRSAVEEPGKDLPVTDDTIIEDIRNKSQLPQHHGVRGDIVVGRHTWKEYVRGLHEGWLGPLDPPPEPIPEVSASVVEDGKPKDESGTEEASKKEARAEEKPKRPPQPRPHNSPEDYSTASLPSHAPSEFTPASVIPFPHRLGIRHTFVRLNWFFNRRKFADDIGREVAAACFAASREFREADGQFEQQLLLKDEEPGWPKSVWKDEPDPEQVVPKEKIWASEIVVDPRVARAMRRFEVRSEDEEKVNSISIPEEELEGWIKRNGRSLWRWAARSMEPKHQGPKVGNLEDD
ncbi:hypothetical protein S7711_07971 [Stachybotrys chartarum IBT 7711]|uniref:Mitochondrial import inner membrane translocase subunit TIM54 n=1 Tax=Stachybotrys chartarum (strain CBS 109288 / IBT 7711) TaxID=1280523 RepID=A0A084ANC0_STACB|nr:hypothetical protein S7711_07971 [Stachybotrys chartarum IBT 7711]KFA48389.1 hypothetical protein S40293_00362 [Stachybotrys chartarum IBT 40293]